MGYIRLTATVKGAVTLGGSPELANHLESADWMSGAALRGALAARWDQNKLGDKDFLDFFCRGGLRFHGLFPVPYGRDGSEAENFLLTNWFPYRLPLAFFQCKNHPWVERGGHTFLSAVRQGGRPPKKCAVCSGPAEQVKAPAFYYLKPRSDKPQPITLNKEVSLYHGADRATRRAKDEVLYSYESVLPDRRFVGWVSGADASVEAWWQEFAARPRVQEDKYGNLTAPLRPRRGKKRRGYLQVTMTKVTGAPNEAHPAAAFLPQPGEPRDNLLAVLLQTPLIRHDPWFRPLMTLSPQDVFGDLANTYSITQGPAYTAATLVEGWSGVHGLPRPPEMALAPGSTFVFQMGNPPATPEAKAELIKELVHLQARGLGERLLEGFGQVLINPPFVL